MLVRSTLVAFPFTPRRVMPNARVEIVASGTRSSSTTTRRKPKASTGAARRRCFPGAAVSSRELAAGRGERRPASVAAKSLGAAAALSTIAVGAVRPSSALMSGSAASACSLLKEASGACPSRRGSSGGLSGTTLSVSHAITVGASFGVSSASVRITFTGPAEDAPASRKNSAAGCVISLPCS